MLNKNIKFFLITFLSITFLLNNNVSSKPLPPGSGEGDVPANILILLDTSASMSGSTFSGDSISYPAGVILLDDGDVVVGQRSKGGVVKFDYSSNNEIIDPNFANNRKVYRGNRNDTCLNGQMGNSRIYTAVYGMGKATDLSGYTGVNDNNGDNTTEVIYVADETTDGGRVVGLSADGRCVEIITRAELGFGPKTLTVRKIENPTTEVEEEFLLVAGTDRTCTRWRGRGNRRRCTRWSTTTGFYSKNLSQGVGRSIPVNFGQLRPFLVNTHSITIDEGNNLYLTRSGSIYKFSLEFDGTTFHPVDGEPTRYDSANNWDGATGMLSASQIRIDPQDDSIMYLTSYWESGLQKISIGSTNFSATETLGGESDNDATPDGATTNSSLVKFHRASALYVGNDTVWIGGNKNSIQEFDISGASIAWVDEMGSAKMNRFTGAKKAIKAVVENSGLLSGAHFGFGYWNAGRLKSIRGGPQALRKWCNQCEKTCHTECPASGRRRRCNDNCNYYDGWTTNDYQRGRSRLCNTHSCLSNGVRARNSQRIVNTLNRLRLEFGTDANAFSQIAYRYFNETNILGDATARAAASDEEDCQLHYVIVIGDGMWTHHDEAREDIIALRELGVKTLFVAYGSGIKTKGLTQFKRMAITGSCDEPDSSVADYEDAISSNPECEPLIEAPDPKSLLTKLESKIQQIVASRLSFTAPSITATLQEGGSLYQAQFAYVQHGEWEGKIVKKTLSADGVVDHDNIVWNTADTVRAQAEAGDRRIWTVLDGTDYLGTWNNFTVENADNINGLFNLLGHEVNDYHNDSSNCNDATGADFNIGADGTSDDVLGLIRFIRGEDYFDYDGDCIVTEIRDSVLGDIYHSQLVEVGPPSANTNFTGTNQEAYYRAKHGYDNFAKNKMTRDSIIYAGANDGMLHAFNAINGREEWAFIPPFIAARMSTMLDVDLDGSFHNVGPERAGGSNPIFGVDGSPVIHDVFVRGLEEDGKTIETSPSWHTYLIINYGRGGHGFSVLDITNPIIVPGQGPLHVFSVYNDKDNQKVWVADHMGNITPRTYDAKSYTIRDSREAQQAIQQNDFAKRTDSESDTEDDETAQEAIVDCQSNFDVASGRFSVDGANACYYGNTFTFDFTASDEVIEDPSRIQIYDANRNVNIQAVSITVNDDGHTVIDFCAPGTGVTATTTITDAEASSCIMIFNDSTINDAQIEDDFFSFGVSHVGVEDREYDYSLLGETWSTPRVFRLPDDTTNIDDDEYVFVMGGGYGTTRGTGSNVFIVSLENIDAPGQIVGSEINSGPIQIADLPDAIACENNSAEICFEEISNSVPGDLVVITPDQFRGVKWRGAMVYASDIEGKITKINLTNMQTNGKSGSASQEVNMFDQTTLLTLNTNNKNSRLLYHGMDAVLGSDTNKLWLFGGTGDFQNMGTEIRGMDNILFGVQDENFPFFQHLQNITIPPGIDDTFNERIVEVASGAPTIDDAENCVDNSDGTAICPSDANAMAWKYQLDRPHDKEFDIDPGSSVASVMNQETGQIDEAAVNLAYGQNRYRKASASPTVYKGNVYFPIYEPPLGNNKCNVGKAFICSADDECGINNSSDIGYRKQGAFDEAGFDENANCYFVRKGVLSKLIVFGDTLFANIATEGEQSETLVQILSGLGEIQIYRGIWRENY